ncbi:MAG: VWA domain-containing protein [Deltaproteobacteria bacterium]|nr:VWA domain-containing protein [Deltaproteobacteria bacterium]
MSRPTKKLGSWLRRHSLTLVAALGGAAGVAYAAGWHSPSTARATAVETSTIAISAAPAPEAVRDDVQDTVQIALILDTSSSMDGLINQARSHLWKIVDDMGKMTRVVNGKTRGVKIELALYEYGNSRISQEAGFIRQVLPLTTDLDKVSEELHGLFTSGGSEFAGQAIETAVTSLQWSSDPAAMRFVFVAGNEGFNQGTVRAETAMAAAAGKDITVQLIYCGHEDTTWEAAAKLAATDLVKIEQNHVAVHIASPQDAEILSLGNELNGTYMAYGAEGRASVERQSKADASSAKLSPKVALERAQLKGKKAYRNDNWDVVDAVENNRKFLEQAPDDKLPAALRGKSLAEKQQVVADNAAKRAELQSKIAKLEAERTRFVEQKRAKEGGAAVPSLETELMKSTKKVATKKGYK